MTVKSEDVEILDDETDDRIDILNHKQELVLVILGIYASLNLIDISSNEYLFISTNIL